MTKTLASLLTVAALALAVTGCGGEPPPAQQQQQESPDHEPLPQQGVLYDTQTIIDYLHLVETEYGDEWTFTVAGPSGKKVECLVTQIFTSRTEVETYASVQDDVAITPEGNAGVEIGGEWQKTCFDAAVEALAGFEASH